MQMSLRNNVTVCSPRSTGHTHCSKIKILGVFFNERLSWDDHIEHVLTIASCRIYALRLMKRLLPKEQLCLIYYGLIRSILEYASPLLVGLNSSLCEKLEHFQRRCHRLICGWLCDRECFPPLVVRRQRAALGLLGRIMSDESHVLFSFLPRMSARSDRFILESFVTTRRIGSFFPSCSLLWNDSH